MKRIELTVDERNRICLTKVSKNLPARFVAHVKDGTIILEPLIEIPEREAWLYKPENKELLAQLREGLSQNATIKLDTIREQFPSFDKYFKPKKSKKAK